MEYGLIGAGPVNQYLAGKLPRLPQDLGPVAATNARLASRIVNTLRAGHALRNLSGLEQTPLILICAPGRHFKSLLPVLENGAIGWRGKAVVLCNCEAFSADLQAIRDAGAKVGSLGMIPGLPGRFLIEGDREAMKAARLLIHELRGAAIEIEPDKYPIYRAALTFASSLFTPALEGAMCSIRHAGVRGTARAQILEALFAQTLREYLYSGRRSWSGAVAAGDEQRIEQDMDALSRCEPGMVDLYRSTAEAAVKFFGKASKAGG